MRIQSYENGCDLHENETACRTHFHMKGFALRLVLKQRHKRTRKWPIAVYVYRGKSNVANLLFPSDQNTISPYDIYAMIRSQVKRIDKFIN